MKKTVLLILLIYGVSQSIAQKHNPKYLRENDPAFEMITKRTTFNGFIEFKEEAKVTAADFFTKYAQNLGLGQHYELQLTKDETDKLQIRHQRYQLYYKKIPVEGAEFTLHSKEGILLSSNGRIVENMDFDLSKPMPEQRALELALADKNLTKADFKDNQKPPTGKLFVAQSGDDFSKESFRLAYTFDIYGKRGILDAHKVFVDAVSGAILKREPLIMNCFGHHHFPQNAVNAIDAKENTPMPTTLHQPLVASTFTPRFVNRYGNSQNFETENLNNDLRLSMNNGALVTRRDGNNPNGQFLWNGGNTEQVFNGNNDIVNPTATWGGNQQNSTTAHWAIQRAYDYFGTIHQQNGPSNNGNIARMITDLNETNAFWDPNTRIIGIGFAPLGPQNAQPNLANSLGALDVCAHEYTHGITQFTAGLSGGGEPRSLNEGLSDIFGTSIERRILPNSWNWTLGEDAYTIRNMANPNNAFPPLTDPQPDRYHGPNWDFSGSQSPHHNNGVLIKWFHSICTGQNPHANNIQAIDFNKAEQIVFRAMKFYLQSSSGYYDMREATIMAARDLYGTCSFEEVQVTNAWAAGAVGATFANVCGNNSPITPGCYGLRAKHSGKYLQAVNNNDNTQLVQNVANGNANQIFRIDQPTNYNPNSPTYRLISQSSFKFVRPNDNNNGSSVVQRFYNSNEQFNYQWSFGNMGNGYYYIHQNGKSIDIGGASQSDGAGAIHWSSHFGDNQLFSLESRTCPAGPQNDCNFGITTNANDTNPPCGSTITLSSSCSGSCNGVNYSWSGNGLNANTASTSVSLPSQGSYTYTLTASKPNCPNQQSNITITVYQVGGGCDGTSCPNTGSISYQRWENIGGGTSIQDLRNNTNNLNNGPSNTQNLTSFEAPLNILDNYGVRIRGYVCPPTTGNYTFWVAGDDNAELWISGNDQPTNLSRIAYHTNWTPSLEWGWFSTQQSAPVTLQAGQRYYVEALMKEGAGGDNLAVGWQLPGGALERPIPGNRLIPFDGGSGGNCNFSVSPSSSNPNPSCGASITLNANCSGSDCGSVSYSWSGNGLSGSNSSVTTNAPSSNGTYTYTVTASKSGCNNQSGNVNVTVSGCGGGSDCWVNKVRLKFREDCCLDRLNGAQIQGSNDGSNWTTLYTFNQNGTGSWQEFTFGNSTAFQRVRFVASGSGYGELWELEFYNNMTKLSGTVFGSDNSGNALDGNEGTFWHGSNFGTQNHAGLLLSNCNPPRIGVAGEKDALSDDTQTLELYPNPTDGKVTVRYYLEKGQKASLQFINTNGQVLLSKGLVGEGGWGQNQTDLSAQPDGVYVIRMETPEKTVSRKFVIAK